MRVKKQWNDEHRPTKKTGIGRRKMTLARDDRHMLRMACRLRQFVDVYCTVDIVQGCLYTGSPSRQTIEGCVYTGLISRDNGKLIGTKLSFQMNHALICGTMMAAFVLDATLVNTAF
ncbi:uncharacterized protein TNCV_3763301 [Trichonephila clavipes]|uniref:Uncharacterized protein n=1 Tax=Trichonephila clavipes TaxID=2585209 RepID=A0A8X6VVA5_TRICX|nr:uncharacterized protein TNCV_3763301 [Trichonephila clavipes]